MFSELEVCDKIGISKATLLNWRREGIVGEMPNDDKVSLDEYVDDICNRVGNKLSSRANRKFSNLRELITHGIMNDERFLLLQNIVSCFEKSGATVEQGVIALIVCQLRSENLLGGNWFCEPQTRIARDCTTWIRKMCKNEGQIPEWMEMFSEFYIPSRNDDFLGAFYQSVQTVSQKALGGSFYTPTKILDSIKVHSEKSVYDPCCGSGNILLNIISAEHDSSKVYASDVDPIALKICETNLVLFFKDANMKAQVFEKSLFEKSLLSEDAVKFDYIVTNPPWGAKFSVSEKRELLRQYSEIETCESFSICLYNAMNFLQPAGKLFFYLPKSFLNVTAHRGIRKYILQNDFCIKIRLFGNIFKGVVSEVILLELQKFNESEEKFNESEEKGNECEEKANECEEKFNENNQIEVITANQKYFLPKTVCQPPSFIIPAKSTPTDIRIQQQLFSHPYITLKNNCDFALGIVTGDNNKYIMDEKNPEIGKGEKVYRGKHIFPYKLQIPTERILFDSTKFQQSAPEYLYRERKIMYRFIANRIICAISENGELPLNSANVFIPRVDYPFETIVALFNSELYANVYKKKYDSVKILRSHIEELPLPVFTQSQHSQIKSLYEQIVQTENNQVLIEKMELFLNQLIFQT